MNFNAFDLTDPATNEHVDVQADHFKVVREIGAAGTVLLKNVDGALPLSKPKSIALIGASPPSHPSLLSSSLLPRPLPNSGADD